MHVDVWQKPTQYCKAIILQLKIDKFKNIYNTELRWLNRLRYLRPKELKAGAFISCNTEGVFVYNCLYMNVHSSIIHTITKR